MAATAYASLVSLLNTFDSIDIHPLVSTFFDKHRIESLSEKVNFLVDFVEKYSDADSREVEDLVRRIADAAHEAEDMIEVYIANRICGGEGPSILLDLQRIIEDMESIKEEVIKVKEEIGKNSKEEIEETGKSPSVLTNLPPSSSSAPPATVEATTMLGFDEERKKLLWYLTGHDVDRTIISITGMGGIGKTTLARNLYEITKRNFHVHVWITVSQESSARKVFLQALSLLGGGSNNMDTIDDSKLSLALYHQLFNRKYLIVLDDVWSLEIWEKIKHFFPENKNGSRIVVTTRESKLFDFIDSSSVALNFLDKENSWKLFGEQTFPQQDFPLELEEVGKKIVEKCKGLPLAIAVIGGLLAKSPRTEEYWEKVAKDKSLILNSSENKPSSILYLSYKYLPVYLKSCFLHLGLYPEDYEFDGYKLIKLWIAEGLIKANRDKSLEEIGESYLHDLADRNLLLLHTARINWIRFSTHDLVRDLCIEVGEKENFFCVQRSIDGNRHFIADQRTARLFPQESHATKTPSFLHPLVLVGEREVPIKTRLLRVFRYDGGSPYDALQEVNMRFLFDNSSAEYDGFLPSVMVSQFWSLQTLIAVPFQLIFARADIWKMPQLRHIDIWQFGLPDPPPHNSDDVCVLQNLQTLKRLVNPIFTKEVCKRIPNIKELWMQYSFSSQDGACSYHLENVGCFSRLESLYYFCYQPEFAGDSLQNIKFPSSLKELILHNSQLEWSYMTAIAALPHLQYLELLYNAVSSEEWIFVDEKFVSLKSLSIFRCKNLEKWIAQSSNFPVLEKLSIVFTRNFDEIPLAIGEISSLQEIYMRACSVSAYMSAVQILHQQESFENLGLQVKMEVREPELMREKIQRLGLTCQNLEIFGWGESFNHRR